VIAATVAAACDWQPSPGAPSPAGLVWTGNAGPSAQAFANVCIAAVPATDLVLAVTASSNVFLDTVTLHLNDGTNLGGPSVTFPRAGLDARFGTTLIGAGTTRDFMFASAVACRPAGSPSADLVLIDASGHRHAITAVVRFH
jgi:hypothetical protein